MWILQSNNRCFARWWQKDDRKSLPALLGGLTAALASPSPEQDSASEDECQKAKRPKTNRVADADNKRPKTKLLAEEKCSLPTSIEPRSASPLQIWRRVFPAPPTGNPSLQRAKGHLLAEVRLGPMAIDGDPEESLRLRIVVPGARSRHQNFSKPITIKVLMHRPKNTPVREVVQRLLSLVVRLRILVPPAPKYAAFLRSLEKSAASAAWRVAS